MSDPVILVKEKSEKVIVDLSKKGVTKFPPLRVRARLDVSGSTSGLYHGGAMERTLEKLLGVAFTFDDDGSIDMGVFDGHAYRLPTATSQDFGTYIKRNILPKFDREYAGSTNYEAALRQEIEDAFGGAGVEAVARKAGNLFGGLFGKKAPAPMATAKEPPVLLFFVTDGDPNGGQDGHNVMEEAARRNLPIYFSLVGVGRTSTNFRTLREMADRYDNVGFVNLDSIDIPDEKLYDALNTDEFITFLKKFGAT